MAFPEAGSPLLPEEWLPAFDLYAANDAWISDDQTALQQTYGSTGSSSGYSRGDADWTHYNKGDGTRRKGGIRGMLSRMFNGQVVEGNEHRTRLHAPIASNLASLSSDLLTAEPPVFRYVNDEGNPRTDTLAKRLDAIMNSKATRRTLTEAAELTAGLGAVVLTAHWDRNVSDMPWLGFSTCDAAIPEFIGGRLAAVNLFTTYPIMSRGIVARTLVHVERHEPGAIVHGLFPRAESGKLADPVPFSEFGPLEHLLKIDGAQELPGVANALVLPTGVEGLTASWWRNLPTKTFRKDGTLHVIGRADFEGTEQFMDAADETWSSWMRDIKIARARLIVPQAFLEGMGPGMGGAFDLDQEILTPLNYLELGDTEETIQAHQFEIRAEEHAATLRALTKEITQRAGYSMSTYGESDTAGASATATEIVDRTTMTERTRDRKQLYFEEAIVPLVHTIMELDVVHFRGTTVPNDAQLDIQVPAISQMDPEKEARMFQYLRTAMAVSTDTLVRLQHEDWTPEQIAAEVASIQRENGLVEEQDAGTIGRAPSEGDTPPEPTDDDEAEELEP